MLGSMLSSVPLTLAGGGEDIAVIAVVGGVTIALISIISGGVASVSRTKQREQSRREIAAYIAEGSMTPEEGERLLKAGVKPGETKC